MLLTYIFVSDILQAVSERERFGDHMNGKIHLSSGIQTSRRRLKPCLKFMRTSSGLTTA